MADYFRKRPFRGYSNDQLPPEFRKHVTFYWECCQCKRLNQVDFPTNKKFYQCNLYCAHDYCSECKSIM
ncbi:uncharacterized protein ASCRUDRAFT_76129 [Ascoidea rubescens DSM 1968]|uniref:Uncharacterized protein n=1 Tax=Ascoidea rubescens DSM 1968 TaxID=1344418 RepID=A0A1D2VGP8_9ASCO|nr:hypothetical protein ASCRUDRAFT_76129 [Ascoidea rubescens DSM 1968]ODV60762.1 hypothetical protein ASCRUDRAFT_76129 [Ascoidea rubescens DSM 1968]